MIGVPNSLLEKIRMLSRETGIPINDLCRKLGIPVASLFISELNYEEMELLQHLTLAQNSSKPDDLLKMIELSLKIREEQTTIYEDFYSRLKNLIKKMNIRLLNEISYNDGNEKVDNKKFFVWLDMLGFKNLAKKCDTKVFYNKVSELIHSFDTAFDEARTIESEIVSSNNSSRPKGTKVEDKIGLEIDFNFRIFSDSIIIWTNSTSYRVLSLLLDLIVKVMQKGFETGMPFRGVLTYGDIFTISDVSNFFLTNEAIYGNALIEAYSLEEKMEWAGVIVTNEAWKHIKEIYNDSSLLYYSETQKNLGVNNLFLTKHILINYPIPMKTSSGQEIIPQPPKKGIAINWDYDGNSTKEMIDGSFTRGEKADTLPDAIRKKYENTLSFWNYVKDEEHFKELPDNS